MEHPFFPTTTTRAEALRWLTIAEKLLAKRDLMGSKSFATRARDSDPTLLPADQILAVADTLISGDHRIGNNLQDWYSILQVSPQQGRDTEVVASQYRRLALLLNPHKNKFAFSEQAFRLLLDAWTVLSNPSKKALYDKELAFYLQPPQPPQPQPFNPLSVPREQFNIPTLPQNFLFFGANTVGNMTHPSHAQPQPYVHGGDSSSSGAIHFPQVMVHGQSHVDPVPAGAIREHASKHPPQNFINFTPNVAFGTSSVSTQESLSKQPPQNFPAFTGNIHSFSGSNRNVHVNENVQERVDAQGVERTDVQEEEEEVEVEEEDEERVDVPSNDSESTFWTACPYCYHMYEYPGVYAECTLRCQKCRRAFHAVVIPSPPSIVNEKDGHFYCWGCLPMGFSMENTEKSRGPTSTWTPFSPMFACSQIGDVNDADKKGKRKASAPRVYVEDDEVFVELSDSSESDGDWQDNRQSKKNKETNVKGKTGSEMPKTVTNANTKKVQVKAKNVNGGDECVPPQGREMPKKSVGDSSQKVGAAANPRKRPGTGAKNFEKLDLNVEFSNEFDEPAPSMHQANGPVRGEDDNIEGIGFFEGLDEFLSSLPILNVVGDDKGVKAA